MQVCGGNCGVFRGGAHAERAGAIAARAGVPSAAGEGGAAATAGGQRSTTAPRPAAVAGGGAAAQGCLQILSAQRPRLPLLFGTNRKKQIGGKHLEIMGRAALSVERQHVLCLLLFFDLFALLEWRVLSLNGRSKTQVLSIPGSATIAMPKNASFKI
ncbi:g4261 [Coccomyxa elongata]